MEPRTELPVPATPGVTLARIKAALEDVPVDRLVEVYEYLISIQEDSEDLAAIEAARVEYKRTGNRGVPLTNYLRERGELEEVESLARSERLISE
ncbi:MAG TPA: hypothetical protein VGK87_07790 [Anaerolineae bacterium]|jgi:hypothetical protein